MKMFGASVVEIGKTKSSIVENQLIELFSVPRAELPILLSVTFAYSCFLCISTTYTLFKVMECI